MTPSKTTSAPIGETALTDRGAAPWSVAETRLDHPEKPRTYWLATVEADGSPHVMPLIGLWHDGAMYFISGEKTRKGRNLADEPRCVVTTGTTTLPSLDLIIEGRAELVTDEGALRALADVYRSKLEWPFEVRDGRFVGPNAPTAGPPPYAVFRLAPSRIFGLPGMLGMEQFDPEDLPRPTRWDFAIGETYRSR